MPGRPLPPDPADLRPIRDELRRFIEFWHPVVDEIRGTGRRSTPRGPRPMLILAAPYLDLSLDPADPFQPRDIVFLVARAVALLNEVLRAIEGGGAPVKIS